jgi:hypothetical protein
MSERFEVGEVAITVNCQFPENNGHEVIILSEREFFRAYKAGTYPLVSVGEDWGYHVQWEDGRKSYQFEHQLRKRHPPQDWVKLCRLTECPDEIPA